MMMTPLIDVSTMKLVEIKKCNRPFRTQVFNKFEGFNNSECIKVLANNNNFISSSYVVDDYKLDNDNILANGMLLGDHVILTISNAIKMEIKCYPMIVCSNEKKPL